MNTMTRHSLTLSLACLVFIAIPRAGLAAQGDCGQPLSNGANPVAGDCLFILKAAIGSQTCEPVCVCDTNNAGGIAVVTAADALLCLKKAVGQAVTLTCPTPCGVVTTSTSTTSSSTSSSSSTITITTTTLSGLHASETFDSEPSQPTAEAQSTPRSQTPASLLSIDGLDLTPVSRPVHSVGFPMCSLL